MNKAAIWHEATQRYCFCLEPGRFLFRLQTGADPIRAVYLHTRDKYLPLDRLHYTIAKTRKSTCTPGTNTCPCPSGTPD